MPQRRTLSLPPDLGAEAELPAPDVPSMRAATPMERIGDRAQDLVEGAAAHPITQLLDLLGLTDLGGLADTFTTPDDGLRLGMAKRIGQAGRTPGWRKDASGRIPRGSQNVDAAAKIPRFRSPAGDFVKYEGEWWRIKPFAQDATDITLEFLGKGPKTIDAKVLDTRTMPMRDFYDSVLKAKQAAAEAQGASGTASGPRRRK